MLSRFASGVTESLAKTGKPDTATERAAQPYLPPLGPGRPRKETIILALQMQTRRNHAATPLGSERLGPISRRAPKAGHPSEKRGFSGHSQTRPYCIQEPSGVRITELPLIPYISPHSA